jgi:hypothetical protein
MTVIRPQIAAWRRDSDAGPVADGWVAPMDELVAAVKDLDRRLDELAQPVARAAADARDRLDDLDRIIALLRVSHPTGQWDRAEVGISTMLSVTGVAGVVDKVLALAGQLCAVIGVPAEIPERPTTARRRLVSRDPRTAPIG